MNNYDRGDLVRFTGTWTDQNDTAVDPTAVFFRTYDPSGNESDVYQYGIDPEVVKSSTGVYYMDVDLDEIGIWRIRAWSTGTGQAAEVVKVNVTSDPFS